jgi:hypothetical protein
LKNDASEPWYVTRLDRLGLEGMQPARHETRPRPTRSRPSKSRIEQAGLKQVDLIAAAHADRPASIQRNLEARSAFRNGGRDSVEAVDVGPFSNRHSRLHDGSGGGFRHRDDHRPRDAVVGVRHAADALGRWRKLSNFGALVMDDCAAVALAIPGPERCVILMM